MRQDRASAEDLWQFCVATYARPGVEAACLRLQEGRGVDIGLLLALIWSGATLGLRLDAALLARLETEIRPWREAVVLPLRAVRRTLKAEAGAPPELAQPIRAKVLASELAAERVAVELLHAVLISASRGAAERPDGPAALAASAANALAYVAGGPAGDGPSAREALRVVLAGAFPAATPGAVAAALR